MKYDSREAQGPSVQSGRRESAEQTRRELPSLGRPGPGTLVVENTIYAFLLGRLITDHGPD